MSYLEKSKKAWEVASGFPVNKEDVYPEHKIVQQFDEIHGKRIYEYGCGNGSDVRSYLKRGNHVTATDIVPHNIETAKKFTLQAGYTEDQFNFILLEDSYPLPLDDNQFDIATSHGVLHHVIEPKPVIEEIHRILKPDGLFYCMLYSGVMEDYFNELGMIDGFMRQYGVSYNEAFGYCTDGVSTPYSRSYNPTQACELICPIGFELIDHTYWLNDHFVSYKFKRV